MSFVVTVFEYLYLRNYAVHFLMIVLIVSTYLQLKHQELHNLTRVNM